MLSPPHDHVILVLRRLVVYHGRDHQSRKAVRRLTLLFIREIEIDCLLTGLVYTEILYSPVFPVPRDVSTARARVKYLMG